jgi:ELWxxDGT repeat protein
MYLLHLLLRVPTEAPTVANIFTPMLPTPSVLILSTVLSAVGSAQSVPPVLTHALENGRVPGVPKISHESGWLPLGDSILFAGTTPTHGSELWKLAPDGTATMVKDIVPGALGGLPVRVEYPLAMSGVVSGGYAWFTVVGRHGVELWRTDGTDAGTTAVVQEWPGGSKPDRALTLRPSADGGIFILTSETGSGGAQWKLWKSDGTTAGTSMFHSGTTSGSRPQALTSAGGTVWFISDGVWKSDGTPSGTVRVYENVGRSTWGLGALSADTACFFARYDSAGQAALMRVGPDGVTHLTGPEASSLIAGSSGSTHIVGGSTIYFASRPGATSTLWKSDGTQSGTSTVTNLPANSYTLHFTPLGGRLLFTDYNPATSARSLWVTDGTPGGTAVLKNAVDDISSVQIAGGRLHFTSGNEVWSTDGTAVGTTLLQDVSTAATYRPVAITGAGNQLYFATGSTPGTVKDRTWISDGTTAGTVVMDHATRAAGNDIRHVAAVGESVLFTQDDGVLGRELWRSDGTPTGTGLVMDIYPGIGSAFGPPIPNPAPAVMGGVYYFQADENQSGRELWRSDGTTTGTWKVKDIAPPGGPGTSGATPVATDSHLYFSGRHPTARGQGMWRTDGTEAGTHVLDIPLAYYPTDLQPLAAAGDRVWFLDGSRSRLWTYHGITGQSLDLMTVQPVVTSTIVGDAAWFFTYDGLVRSDGTVAGSTFVKSWPTIAGGWLGALGNRAAALKYDHYLNKVDDAGLWISDGTTAGTIRVKGGQPSADAAVLDGTLYFLLDAPQADAGLWRSDGTVAGTSRVRTFTNGGQITTHGGRLYFNANDGIHGEELWESDGTTAGTRMLADIAAGTGGSAPGNFTTAGTKLFLAARTEELGHQLYVLGDGSPLSPYEGWLATFRDRMDGKTGRKEDADGDGVPNVLEFALGGDPADPASKPITHAAFGDSEDPQSSDKYLTLTVRVLAGTVFTPGAPATGVADGVTYRFRATTDLGTSGGIGEVLEVIRDTTAAQPPQEDGYEYLTVRVAAPVNDHSRAFIQVVVD